MFPYLRVFLSITIQFVLLNEIKGQISPYCYITKVNNPTPLPAQTIFYYRCYPPTSNPPFVSITSYGSLPTEFTQLILNPNTYSTLPILDICSYTNINLLDVSNNQLTSVTGVFQSLSCLASLTTLVMANNFITSPIKQSDFSDSIAQQLVSLDLSYNQVQSIDSNVFIKSDGTNRFKNLQYLSLKNNQIMQFDLLWPLTIPPSILNVDFSSNLINSLVNGLSLSYSATVFAYPMAGNRNVNLQNNSLSTFSDSNLLQYGLTSANDLNLFLKKLANYDLRKNSQSSTSSIVCTCPSSGSQLVTWYKQLLASGSINLPDVVNQLYCSNIGNTYPLNINCSLTPSTVLSTTSTVAGITVTSTIPGTTVSGGSPSAGAQQVTTIDTSSNLFLLFLLIPLVLIIIILIILCCLRPWNKFLFHGSNTTCFRSCRPGESKEAKMNKKFDATILYSEYDDSWVRSNLLPIIKNQGKPYKINMLTTVHKCRFEKDQIESLNQSKRVILIMSKNFMKEEWKSDSLQSILKNICAHDSDCVIVPIIINQVFDEEIHAKIEQLQENDEEESCSACSHRVKYSTVLDNIEPLNSSDTNFSNDLNFLMPIMKPTGAEAIITESSPIKRDTRTRDTLSPFSLGMESDTSYLLSHRKETPSIVIKNEKVVNSRDDLPLISNTKIKHDRIIQDDQPVPFNKPTPRESKKKEGFTNRFLSPSDDDEGIFKIFNKKNKSNKSPRKEVEKAKISEKVSRDIEEQGSSRIVIDSQIPNKHTNSLLISALNDEAKKSDNTDKKLVANSSALTFSRSPEMIPVNANLNYNSYSNVLVPIVSASSNRKEPAEMSEDETVKREKKSHKKHKNKEKRSRRSKTEENNEKRDYNILPVSEPGFVSVPNDETKVSNKKHRNHSNDS